MPLTAILGADLPIALDFLASMTTAVGRLAAPQRALPTDVSVTDGADAVAQAAPAWRMLEGDGAATPFQTFAVADAVSAAHLARGETPRIVVVRERGRPVVIFPTVVSRRGGVPVMRFLGDPLIQYGDMLAAPDATPAHIRAAWHAAVDADGVALVHLRKVRADAHIAPLLAAEAVLLEQRHAPFVDLTQPANTAQRHSRELARLRRRLGEHGDVRLEEMRGAAAIAAIDEAFALKRSWLNQRGLSSRVIGDPHWETALRSIASAGDIFRVVRLTAGGKSAAIELALASEDRWCAFLGAISPDHARAGPGLLQMDALIARCRADGVKIYDLMAPADGYKRRITDDAVAVRDYGSARNARGRLLFAAMRTMPLCKALIVRLPVGLRRMLFTALTQRFPAQQSAAPRDPGD